jgi:hypothetical protein
MSKTYGNQQRRTGRLQQKHNDETVKGGASATASDIGILGRPRHHRAAGKEHCISVGRGSLRDAGLAGLANEVACRRVQWVACLAPDRYASHWRRPSRWRVPTTFHRFWSLAHAADFAWHQSVAVQGRSHEYKQQKQGCVSERMTHGYAFIQYRMHLLQHKWSNVRVTDIGSQESCANRRPLMTSLPGSIAERPCWMQTQACPRHVRRRPADMPNRRDTHEGEC